jgi:acyl-CoA synthetase (NDP forming)
MSTMFLQYDMKQGYIGMASQSGSFITQIFVHLEKFGLGFSQAFSVGNEASVDITDCIEYLGDCPNTKVIVLYIETIRRGKRFLEVARKVSKKKPIVAYYVGGSKAGRQAALSHTGAMAGPNELYDGLFKQSGVIRAYSIEELFDFAYVLGTQPIPQGNRIAILTHSGGPGASAANTADDAGLTLSVFGPKTMERLREFLPPTASSANPVDVTFSRDQQAYTNAMPRALLEDPAVDMVFIYFMMPKSRVAKFFKDVMNVGDKAEAMASEFIESQCEAVSKLAAEYGKPVVGASFYTRDEEFVVYLQDRNFVILTSPERAVKAMAALTEYARTKID